jgi:sugar lactone lactonase YvrE
MKINVLYFVFLVIAINAVSISCKKSEQATYTTPPAQQLTIKSISPLSGPAGTVVTITGANFSANIANDIVSFNGKTALVQSAKSDTLIVIVPSKAGTGGISVTVNGVTVTSSVFTYIPKVYVTTLAGNGIPGNIDGAAANAEFYYPRSLTVDRQGFVYAYDGNHRIRKISPTGDVSQFSGSGNGGYYDAIASFAMFSNALGLTVDARGYVYATDRDNECIRKITPAGDVTTLAGKRTYGYKDASDTAARFWEPEGIAIDSSGNLYVADNSNHRIRKVTPAGVVTTLAGNGIWGYANGSADIAQFSTTLYLCADTAGIVYVSDGQRIRKIASGAVTTLAGSGANSYQNGTGTNADFANPLGIAIDKQGNLYVADNSNHCIRKITPAGVVTLFAGTAEQSGFADGPAATAKFYYPEGVAVDNDGNVYVADEGNNRIRKIYTE